MNKDVLLNTKKIFDESVISKPYQMTLGGLSLKISEADLNS